MQKPGLESQKAWIISLGRWKQRESFSGRNSKWNAVSCPSCPVENAVGAELHDGGRWLILCESRISRLEKDFWKIGGEQPSSLAQHDVGFHFSDLSSIKFFFCPLYFVWWYYNLKNKRDVNVREITKIYKMRYIWSHFSFATNSHY